MREINPEYRITVKSESLFKWTRMIKLFIHNCVGRYKSEEEIAECIRMQNPNLSKNWAGFVIHKVIDDVNGFGKIFILSVNEAFFTALEQQHFRMRLSYKEIQAEVLIYNQ